MNEIEKKMKQIEELFKVKEDGLHTEWYENGQKKEEGIIKNGEKDGLWTEWYENGQKEREATFKDGYMDGLASLWHMNGKVRSVEFWKDEKVILGMEWDEDGELIDWENENNRKI